MDKIFIDTAFVIALINRKDQYHNKASDLADKYEGYPLVTSDGIILEIGNALSKNFKQESIDVINQFHSSDEVTVVQINTTLFEKAFDLYCKYKDKTWSLVDCISFIVMQEMSITLALTSDKHFEQAGFQVLMVE